MSLVDWKQILPPEVQDTVHVYYSHLTLPEDRDELEQDVARLGLTNGYGVDIEWCNETGRYTLTLYLHLFDKDIIRFEEEDVNSVIETVKSWATQYAAQPSARQVAVSDATTSVENLSSLASCH